MVINEMGGGRGDGRGSGWGGGGCVVVFFCMVPRQSLTN